MASTQRNFYFPHLPPPPSHPFNPPPSPFHPFNQPPPPSHSLKSPPPPSHPISPPPPPHVHPPPAPSPHHPISPQPPPRARPPPSPHHPISPPPPHVRPPPPQLPPSPTPYHPTVIVIVIVSLGGLALLSLLAFALFCCIQKRKKKTQETDIIHFDEHKKVTETIVPGPFGRQVVVISAEDDVHIDEEIRKKEILGHGSHAKSSKAEVDQGNSSSTEVRSTPGREQRQRSSTT